MTYDEKVEMLINNLYADICPKPEKGKLFIPIISGMTLLGNPETDEWLEKIAGTDINGRVLDISDAIVYPKEKTKDNTDRLAIHTKYMKLNIVFAHFGKQLDWKTIETDEYRKHSDIPNFGSRIYLDDKEKT